MNQTNIDYLFQVTAPIADRGLGSARTSDDAPAFGDHLSQASATPRDEPPKPSRSETAAGYASVADSNPSSSQPACCESTTAGEPTNSKSNDDDAASAPTKPPAAETSSANAGDEKPPTDEVDGEHHDADESVEADTAELANVAPVACEAATPKAAKAARVAEIKSSEAVNEVATSVVTNEACEKLPANSDEQSATGDLQAHEAKTRLVAAAENESAAVQIADAACETKPDEKIAATTDEPQHDAKAGAPQIAFGGKDALDADKNPVKRRTTTAQNIAATGDTKESTARQAQSNVAAVSAPASNQPADSDASSSDEPRRASKTTARSSSRSDVAPQTNKSDTTAIANGVAANAADAQPNSDTTGEASEQPVKAVSSKGESAVAALGRVSRASAGTNRSGRTTGADEAPRVDPARFVGRVAKAFQTAHERGGTLQLRLSPPELGSLRLQLTVKDGALTAALETDNANARRVLLDHLPALRDRLAEQNIRVERFDVDVRREGTGSQADARGSQQQPNQHRPGEPAPRRHTAAQQRERELTRPEVPTAATRTSSTGINLIV